MVPSPESRLVQILGELSEAPSKGFTKVYNRYTNSVEEVKLSLLNSVSLALTGETCVGDRIYPGWTGKIPFFVYTCNIAGYKVTLLDYRHGFNDRLDRYIQETD